MEVDGDLEQEPQPWKRRIWSVVLWSRKVPLDTCFPKKTASLIQEKREDDYHGKKHEMHQNWKSERNRTRVSPGKQRKKVSKFVGKQDWR